MARSQASSSLPAHPLLLLLLLVSATPLARGQEHTPAGNITAAFRGTWRSADTDDSLQRWLRVPNGTVFLSLTASSTSVEAVEDVKGELVLATADVGLSARGDVRLGVDGGVYVADTGRLVLRMSSHRPTLWGDIPASDAEAMAPIYRAALVEAAQGLLSGDGGRLFAGRNGSATGHAPSGVKKLCRFQLEAHAATVPMPLQDWGGVPSVHMNGTLVSQECGVNLEVHLVQLRTEFAEKAKSAGMLSGMLVLVMISLTARQLEASASPAAMQRIAFGCVCHQGMLDSCACVLHLMAGIIADELFATFSFVALGYFVLFSFLEMRLLTGIWRARLPNGGTLAELRDSMRSLHTHFYGAMALCGFGVLGLRQHMTLLMLCLHSFWVWQIIHTAVHDVPRPLSMDYVFGMSACRLVMPSYFLACPRNWARVVTQPLTALLLVGWVGAQVGVVYAQHVWGARWFVPPSLRPPKWDYHRPATPAERAAAGWDAADADDAENRGQPPPDELECVICQAPLPREHSGEQPRGRMVTPCGHWFHTSCLDSWMAIKLECPTCRGTLPLP